MLSTSNSNNTADPDDIKILTRDPASRRSFINKTAYKKLHQIPNTTTNQNPKKNTIDFLKDRFESKDVPNSVQPKPSNDIAAFIEPLLDEDKPTKPVIADKPTFLPVKPNLNACKLEGASEKNVDLEALKAKYSPANYGYPKISLKDENSNFVNSSDGEEDYPDSDSSGNVDFSMDGKHKERKRSNSFRKLFTGGFFGKDKKKKEEKHDLSRGVQNISLQSNAPQNHHHQRFMHHPEKERKQEETEKTYAKQHVNRFNEIRQNFVVEEENKPPQYLPMNNPPKKKSIADYLSPVNKYIDTSSSASLESERPKPVMMRDTPPRAQETYQNFKPIVKPRAYYQNQEKPEKPYLDDTYGTVFDSLEYVASKNGNLKPVSPKSPSFEGSKLKLPPNRDIVDLQPRLKSPLASNRVSTEKMIATELLKNSRPPTPTYSEQDKSTPLHTAESGHKSASRHHTMEKSGHKRAPRQTIEESGHKSTPHRTIEENGYNQSPPVSPIKPRRHLSVTSIDQSVVMNAMVHDNSRRSEIIRPTTPLNLRQSAALKLSPQKEDIRKSVEQYYWKEIKKLKDEEDYKLYVMQMSNGLFDDSYSRLRRSRSLSPSQRNAKSFSLPRDVNKENPYGSRKPQNHQIIPEDQTIEIRSPARKLTYEEHFIRNQPERRSIDSLQRPIFRRGSLVRQEIYENNNYNKRVSFSNGQQQWPTKNGFTGSPPQRRLEKRDPNDVFGPNEPNYVPKPPRREPVYVQNLPIYQKQNYYSQEPIYGYNRQEPVYGTTVSYQNQYEIVPRPIPAPIMGPRRLSVDSLQRPVPNTYQQPMRRDIFMEDDGIYGRFGGYPAYQVYPQKQVTVRDKYCDFYGQIHDSSAKTGVLMGQVVQKVPPQNFARGTRLSSSAHNMGYNTRYKEELYDNKPLPPVPRKNHWVSDTESEMGDIGRRVRSNKERSGYFGK